MKHKFPILILLLLFTVACKKEQSVVQILKEQNKVENSYYVYPSTLRMLNFADVESINKVVKDIKKASLLNMNIDSFDFQQLTDISVDLQEKEGYELYLEVVDTEKQMYILGNESSDKTMFLASNEGRHYILDIEGRPDYFQLAMAWKDFNNLDSTSTIAYEALTNMVSRDSEWKDRRRASARKRAEAAAAEQAKQDSIDMAKDSIQLLD